MHRLALLLFTAGLTSAWSAPMITLFPDNAAPIEGNLLAGNGDIHGWGITIQNDNSGFLVIGSVQIGDTAPVGSASNFTDLLSPWVGANSYAIAPGASLHLDWVPGSQGLGEFQFPSSPVGYLGPVSPLTIFYDVFDANPFTDPYTTDDAGATSLVVTLSVTEPSSTVPEPATWALLSLGLTIVALGRRRSR